MSRPPRVAEALLRRLLPSHRRNEVLGDLAEAYALRRSRRRAFSGVWYWGQVIAVPTWLLGTAVLSRGWDRAEAGRAVRGLARSPGFAIMAVLSLALGIGSTTTIVGALRAILYIPLPVERPGELSLVYHTWPERWEGSQYGSNTADDPRDGMQVSSNVSFPAYRALLAAAEGAIQLSAFAFVREMSILIDDRPALSASGMLVSGDYFGTLRLRTELGRPLTESDDRADAPRAVVISHSLWQRAFGGDPTAVGRSIALNGEGFEIVGVAQADYVGLSPGGFSRPSDVMIPIAQHPVFLSFWLEGGETMETAADKHWVRLIARSPSGVSTEPVIAGMSTALGQALVADAIIAAGTGGNVEVRFLEGRRGIDSLEREAVRPLRIGVVVILVLLVACANLATLLLARGASRRHELALRRAIGASRWELARPLFAESLFVALLGGVAGLIIALWVGPPVVSALTDSSGAVAQRFDLDWLLVGAAVVGAVVSALVSSALPAVRMMQVDPGPHLGSRGAVSGGHRFRLGRGLIAAQIAVSVPLIVGAGLFLRTLGNLAGVDPGFDPNGLLVFTVDASLVTREADEEARLYGRILSELESTPGVESVSVVENVLVSGWRSNTRVTIEGERHMMDMNAIGPAFIETFRIPLVAGRTIERTDGPNAPHVALVNETAERTLFGGKAIGRRFSVGNRDIEIVGVVADTKYTSLRAEVNPTFFDPFEQRTGGLFFVNYVVRTQGPPMALESTVRELVARAHRGLPVTSLRAQTDEVVEAIAREKLFARLLTAFGAFALVLACVGLYGVTSFAVARRKAEMGIRLALGAAPEGIVRMVLAQVLRLTVLGLVVGLFAAYLSGSVVESMLYGLDPGDPLTLVAAAGAMIVVALAAGGVPAWRASRVDPISALSPPDGG